MSFDIVLSCHCYMASSLDPVLKALYCAARQGNLEMVQYLLEYGSEPNLTGLFSSFTLVLLSDAYTCVVTGPFVPPCALMPLLPLPKEQHGSTPLHAAAYQGHLDCCMVCIHDQCGAICWEFYVVRCVPCVYVAGAAFGEGGRMHQKPFESDCARRNAHTFVSAYSSTWLELRYALGYATVVVLYCSLDEVVRDTNKTKVQLLLEAVIENGSNTDPV